MLRRILLTLLCLLAPGLALANFDGWSQKAKIAVDTSATGANTKGALTSVTVPVRLHTGNFDFKAAKADGSDLRFSAADGKTELAHRLEFFDAQNELAVAWVLLPTLAPNAKDQFIHVHYGNPKAEPTRLGGAYDERTVAWLHFGSELLANAAGPATPVAGQGMQAEPIGVSGQAAKSGAGSRLVVGGDALRMSADGMTVSGWVRADAPGSAVLLRIGSAASGVEVALDAGVPVLKAAGVPGTGSARASAPLKPGQWQHVALVVGERTVLFVDGQEAVSIAARAVDLPGAVTIAEGFVGALDEIVVSRVARVPEWVKVAVAAQGPDGTFIALAVEEAGEIGYLKILIDNLTVDAEVVIGILAVMFVIAVWIMIVKAMTIARVSKANAQFIRRFRESGEQVFVTDEIPAGVAKGGFADSTLYPVFETARTELRKRLKAGGAGLPTRSITAIESTVAASVLKENVRLNRWIVLLTIAISGGPFLGLLGTVVGVMITFAAIAAVGDVNINAIAPGIAAALLATVAGLAVAIPALFGYNYLASRIKDITNDTSMFGDEVVSRLAESHGA